MTEERCETCRFWKERGACRRYPESTHKLKGQWCGEWRAKPQAEPERHKALVGQWRPIPGRSCTIRDRCDVTGPNTGRPRVECLECGETFTEGDIFPCERAKEPEKPKAREPGAYWVREAVYGWAVAAWDGKAWELPGSPSEWADAELQEIDERRIVREP